MLIETLNTRIRPVPIMLKILPIILLRIFQIFHSFVLNLLFQNNSQKIHLY